MKYSAEDNKAVLYSLKGKKFVSSYSGGKDSAFALFKAKEAGMIPAGIITTYNTDANRSWFHGITGDLLNNAAKSLKLPLTLIKTGGKEYGENFVKALLKAKEDGAEACVFGDMDIEGHIEWCTEHCRKAGLSACFPLLGIGRENAVNGFIDAGFKAIITIIDTTRMPEYFHKKILTEDIAKEIKKSGADICGENGEYHTFVFDGPIFEKPIAFKENEIIRKDNYLILSLGTTL